MYNKKSILMNIIKTILLFVIIVFSCIPKQFAINTNEYNKTYQYIENNRKTSIAKIEVADASEDAKLNLRNLDAYNSKGAWSQKFLGKVDIIFAAIRVVGIIISVIILVMIGLKFMFASVEEKAEYKKSLIPYIIGALLLFSGSLLAEVIYHYAVAIVNLV